MATRENRMLDAILLGSLGQDNAFFASTSAIAVGGLAATIGSGERARAVGAAAQAAPATPFVWKRSKCSSWAFSSRRASICVGVSALALCHDHHRRDADACREHGSALQGSRRAHGPPCRIGRRSRQQWHPLLLPRDCSYSVVLASRAVHARCYLGDHHRGTSRFLFALATTRLGTECRIALSARVLLNTRRRGDRLGVVACRQVHGRAVRH